MQGLRRKARKWIRRLRWREIFFPLAVPARWPEKRSWLWPVFGALILATTPGILPPLQEVLRLLLRASFKESAEITERLIQNGGPILGVILLGWWGLSRWAAPRARFWEEIEGRGLRVIFPSGHRADLLEEAARILPLGLGPTGKLLPIYIKRKEEEAIRRLLGEGQHVVITAPPAAGKTRTMLEIAIDLDSPFILIGTREVSQIPFPRGISLPAPWALLLVDDVALRPGGEPWPDPLPSLRHYCPGLRILATVRSDRLPPNLRSARIVELKEIPLEDLRELVQQVAEAEGRSSREIQNRYNGHPGSIVAGLEAMQARWQHLGEEFQNANIDEPARRAELGRAFLQSARLLWTMGVRILSVERIWAITKEVWEVSPTRLDQEEVVKGLANLQFFRQEGARLLFYEGILTEVISAPAGLQDAEQRVWEALRAEGDAAAFMEIGTTWSEEYGPHYQWDPRRALRRAIAAYQEALRFRTPETTPLWYAETQHHLGLAWRRWAEIERVPEQRCVYLRAAIRAFREALRFRTPETTPLWYAETQEAFEEAQQQARAWGCPEEPT